MKQTPFQAQNFINLLKQVARFRSIVHANHQSFIFRMISCDTTYKEHWIFGEFLTLLLTDAVDILDFTVSVEDD